MNQNRYEILEPLGKGQNGQTILAHFVAPNSSQPLIVIKQLNALQEPFSALTKRLKAVSQHPQLPSLIDSWQTLGSQFFAFEYIAAPPITESQTPPWSPIQVETWLLTLLPVLEHIHSFRLIHGDIRPDNIRGGHQSSILIDLRITQRLGKHQTAIDVMGGDAIYAAPEQTLGQLVYASDLYSLGLVAIHLLTGLTPFDLYSVADNRWIWSDLVTESLPQNLRQVLNKLLERSLENRYTNAAQVIRDLKQSPTLSLLNKARSFLPLQESLPLSLPAITKLKSLAFSPSTTTKRQPNSERQVSWQLLHQLSNGITTALALQGTSLAMGNSSGSVLLCDLAKGAEVYQLRGRLHSDRVTALAFHPQNRILYSASSDGKVKQWDLLRGELAHTLSQPGWQPTDLAVAPPYLVVSDGTGYIDLWDLDDLKHHHRFNQHQDWVNAIATNGQRLASISRDRTLRLWSLSDKTLLNTLSISPSQALALHPSGSYVIVGNDQGQVEVWSLGQSVQSENLCTETDGIIELALSPDARLLAVGTDGNALRVYQGTDGQCVSELVQGWGVVAIAFDGRTLVSSSQDEIVTIWQRRME